MVSADAKLTSCNLETEAEHSYPFEAVGAQFCPIFANGQADAQQPCLGASNWLRALGARGMGCMGRRWKEESRASNRRSSPKRVTTPQTISCQTPCCGQKASSYKRPQNPIQPNEVKGRPEGWRAQSPESFQREVRNATW